MMAEILAVAGFAAVAVALWYGAMRYATTRRPAPTSPPLNPTHAQIVIIAHVPLVMSERGATVHTITLQAMTVEEWSRRSGDDLSLKVVQVGDEVHVSNWVCVDEAAAESALQQTLALMQALRKGSVRGGEAYEP